MKQKNGKWKLIVAILAVAIVLGGLLTSWLIITNYQTDGKIARIYQGDTVVYEVDLSKVEEPYTYRVEGKDGAYNDILIEPGKISCCEANCPDQVCVNMGKIDSGMLPITCLPHQVLIKIESE